MECCSERWAKRERWLEWYALRSKEARMAAARSRGGAGLEGSVGLESV